MRGRRGLALVVMLAGAGLVVSACGSDSARSAAEEELDVDEVVVVDDADDTDDTEDSGDADAADTESSDTNDAGNPTEPAEPENLFEVVTSGNLGTQICVFNDTGEIDGISVEFTRADTSSNGPLSRWGMSMRCGEGTRFIGTDVIGKIYFAKKGAATYEFDATNPWAGLPSGGFKQETTGANSCLGGEFEVGSSGTYDDGVYSITMSREPDFRWKQFLLTIRPSSAPSSDGKAKQCPRSVNPARIR